MFRRRFHAGKTDAWWRVFLTIDGKCLQRTTGMSVMIVDMLKIRGIIKICVFPFYKLFLSNTVVKLQYFKLHTDFLETLYRQSHILLYKWFMHGKSPSKKKSRRTPTPYKIKEKTCTLIELVKIIELTWAILIPRFSNFQRNSTILVRMFLYLVTCFLSVAVSLQCRLQAVSKIRVPIYPCLISESKLNYSTFWPAQQRNRDLMKHVTKYKNMRKWMVEFLWKFENRSIKIARQLNYYHKNLSI